MNGAHLHLVLNHFPVIGLIFCLAMLMAGILRKSEELTRTGMVILIAVAVIAIPVYLTGEPAEEIVERLGAPLIYVTACHEAEIELRASQTAPFGYVIKPFEPAYLAAVIERALEGPGRMAES